MSCADIEDREWIVEEYKGGSINYHMSYEEESESQYKHRLSRLADTDNINRNLDALYARGYYADRDKQSCEEEISVLKAMKQLATHDLTAIIVKIRGLKIGMCDNDAFMNALDHEINERLKYLNGQDNKWI